MSDEQAINERTLNDAIGHLRRAEMRLNTTLTMLDGMKENSDKGVVTINGPILVDLPDIHDLIIKAYNTVQYLKEQEHK